MSADQPLPPVLVVAGPTASGKSRLAIDVALSIGGEIVSADAFAVYRGLDIGTDKPPPDHRRGVPHHLFDIADPAETFSAGDFIAAADRAIADIHRRDRVPIIAGGTHFYIESLLYGLFPSPPRDPEVRASLQEAWSTDPDGVFRKLKRVDPQAATRIGPADRQRILRALEVFTVSGERISSHWENHEKRLRHRALLTAPERSREELYANIDRRVEEMFAGGLEDEVRRLLNAGIPYDAHSLKAIGYREVVSLLRGRCSREEAVSATKRSSRKLAKRQLTWLRGPWKGRLRWVPPAERGGADAIRTLWFDFATSGEDPAPQNRIFQPPNDDYSWRP